jgi:hypothetical protein
MRHPHLESVSSTDPESTRPRSTPRGHPVDGRPGFSASRQLYVVCPVVAGFAAVFLTIGLRNFRRRVLS